MRLLAQIGATAVGILVVIWLAEIVTKVCIWVAAAFGALLADASARRIERHYRKDKSDREEQS